MMQRHNTIQACIESAGQFTEVQAEQLASALKERKLKKGERLLNIGDVCKTISFLVSGTMIQYYEDTALDRKVIDLYTAGEWVLNHSSFTGQKPSLYLIEAASDAHILELHMETAHKLIAKDQRFLQMGKLLDAAAARLQFFDQQTSPDAKYLYLQESRPQLLQAFSQKLIASYLKMTPETLSRVRARIHKT